MRILWLSHFVPFPPRGGALQRSFSLIRELSKLHRIFLIAFNFQGETDQQVKEYAVELGKFCERVEIWDLPYLRQTAKWWAALLASPISRLPFSCRVFWSRSLAARWQISLRNLEIDLLHVDGPDLAPYGLQAKGLRKVLNHHNCESVMVKRWAEGDPHPAKRLFWGIQSRKLARLEREACNLFNVNTVVSERDAHFLRNQSPEAHIHLVENGVDTRYFSPCRHEEQPGSLIFTGSLNWHPNVNALRFFAREIWPLIKHQCSGAHLYLAGRSPHSSLLDWARRDPSVEVAANPDDIRPWIARACVFVCPILEGGGTRLKILDAMAMARPVVSTTIGCEGLRVTAGENILVADTPQDFASRVVNLLENSDQRRQLGTAGRTLVEKHYDWEIIAHQLHLAYRCALDPETCNLEMRNTVSEATASRRLEGS